MDAGRQTSTRNTGGGAPTPPDAIGPGEIERSVNNTYDWTCDWGWQMSLQILGSRSEWLAWACIYLNDLPGLLDAPDPIPWTDPSRTQKLSGDDFPRCYVDPENYFEYQCIWKFREKGPCPRWGIRVAVRHNDTEAIAGIDPWAFLTSAFIQETDINQRTGPGRCKKVMWYRKSWGYGNDLVGQPVKPWNSAQEAEFAAFADRILPSGFRRPSWQ